MADSDYTLSLLKSLNFDYKVDENGTRYEYAFIRAKFKNSDDVSRFVEYIEASTDTSFKILVNKSNPIRLTYRKKWICEHSSHGKTNDSEKDIHCAAFIDVLIKKVNRNTKKNDKFLKWKEPLPCVIKINLKHSHPTKSADVLKKLPVAPEVIKEFEGYFERGLTVADALMHHASNFIAECDYDMLFNSSYNPNKNQISYLYEKWRHKKTGQVSKPLSTLKRKSSAFENEDTEELYDDSSAQISSENSENSNLSQGTSDDDETLSFNEMEISNLNPISIPKKFKRSKRQGLRSENVEKSPVFISLKAAQASAPSEKTEFKERKDEKEETEQSLKVSFLEKEHSLKIKLMRRKHFLKAQLLKKQIELKDYEINVQKKILEILETNPQNLSINLKKMK